MTVHPSVPVLMETLHVSLMVVMTMHNVRLSMVSEIVIARMDSLVMDSNVREVSGNIDRVLCRPCSWLSC